MKRLVLLAALLVSNTAHAEMSEQCYAILWQLILEGYADRDMPFVTRIMQKAGCIPDSSISAQREHAPRAPRRENNR